MCFTAVLMTFKDIIPECSNEEALNAALQDVWSRAVTSINIVNSSSISLDVPNFQETFKTAINLAALDRYNKWWAKTRPKRKHVAAVGDKPSGSGKRHKGG
jgi:hypothetical protein